MHGPRTGLDLANYIGGVVGPVKSDGRKLLLCVVAVGLQPGSQLPWVGPPRHIGVSGILGLLVVQESALDDENG